MAKYDANSDGLIDLGEFVAVSQDAVFRQGHLAEYREAFRCTGRGRKGGRTRLLERVVSLFLSFWVGLSQRQIIY